MSRLSPSYRNDKVREVSPELNKFLETHFLTKLNNINNPNPKLLVVFSGGNGVGKSTLSTKIALELGAVVLENDAIKLTLLEYNPNLSADELNSLAWSCSLDFYKRISHITNNGLIVRDGVIDWYFDRILPIFEKQNYSLFVIGFDISQEKNIEIINVRADKPTVGKDILLKQMFEHRIHTKRFRSIYPVDCLLTDANMFDYELVIQKLKAKLVELA